MLFGFWQLKTTVYALLLASCLGQELIRTCDRDYCYEPLTERRYQQNNQIDWQRIPDEILDNRESLKPVNNENRRDHRTDIRDRQIDDRDLELGPRVQREDLIRSEFTAADHRRDNRQVINRRITTNLERRIERSSRNYVNRQEERENRHTDEFNRQDIHNDHRETRRLNRRKDSRRVDRRENGERQEVRQVARRENGERQEIRREINRHFDDSRMEQSNSRVSDNREERREETRLDNVVKSLEINSRNDELEGPNRQNNQREIQRVNLREESRQIGWRENGERHDISRQFDDSEVERNNLRLSDDRVERREETRLDNYRVNELERRNMLKNHREIRRINRREESRQVSRRENGERQEIRREKNHQFDDSRMERSNSRVSDYREERREETRFDNVEKSIEINSRIDELERTNRQNNQREIRRINRREESRQIGRRENGERQEISRQFDDSEVERNNLRLYDDRLERREKTRLDNYRANELERQHMLNNRREESRQVSRRENGDRREISRQFDNSEMERYNIRLSDDRVERREEIRLDNQRVDELKRQNMFTDSEIRRVNRREESIQVAKRDNGERQEISRQLDDTERRSSRLFDDSLERRETIRDSNELQDSSRRLNEHRLSNREPVRDERHEASRTLGRHFDQRVINKRSLGPNADFNIHSENRIVSRREEEREEVLLTERRSNDVRKETAERVRQTRQRRNENKDGREGRTDRRISRSDKPEYKLEASRRLEEVREHRRVHLSDERDSQVEREALYRNTENKRDRHLDQPEARRRLLSDDSVDHITRRSPEISSERQHDIRQRRNDNKFDREERIVSTRRNVNREVNRRLESERESRRENVIRSDERDSQGEKRQRRDEDKLDNETRRETARRLNNRDTERRAENDHSPRRVYLLRSVERNSKNVRDSSQRRDEERREAASRQLRQSRDGRKQVREERREMSRRFDKRNRLEDERESREINRVDRQMELELSHSRMPKKQKMEEDRVINERESKRLDEREYKTERATLQRRTNNRREVNERFDERVAILTRGTESRRFEGETRQQYEDNKENQLERENRVQREDESRFKERKTNVDRRLQSVSDSRLGISTHLNSRVHEDENRIRLERNAMNRQESREDLRRQEENSEKQYSRNDSKTESADIDRILPDGITRKKISRNEHREHRFIEDDEFVQKPTIFLKNGYIALGQGVLLAIVIMKTLNGNDDLKHKLPNKSLKAFGIMGF